MRASSTWSATSWTPATVSCWAPSSEGSLNEAIVGTQLQPSRTAAAAHPLASCFAHTHF